MDALKSPGVTVDIEALLGLRYLSRRLAEPQMSANSLPGGLVNKRRGRGLEAAEIRHFVEGDDVRLIDRNVTARTGELHVRTVHDERDQTVLLMADFRPSMLWGTRRAFRSVAAAEALSLIGWRVVENGGRVALLAFGGFEPVVVPPRGRERGMVAVIGGLAAAHSAALAAGGEPVPENALTRALEMAGRICPSGSTVYIASCLEDQGAGYELAIRALNQRCPVNVLRMTDAFELAAPGGFYPFQSEGGTRRSARLSRNTTVGGEDLDTLNSWKINGLTVNASLPPEVMAGEIGALYV